MQRTESLHMPVATGVEPVGIDFTTLSFSYTQTRSFVMYTYDNGAWDKGMLINNPYLPLHIGTQALHYGQAVFEGLKAFRTETGEVRLFRPQENAKRLIKSCERLSMQAPTEKIFLEAISALIKDNIDYVPPFSSKGSLYIRPLVIGSSAVLGVSPSSQYRFIVFCSPVGAYYKNGLKGVKSQVVMDFDRAAPNGTGSVKCAGNYAASLLPHMQSLAKGFPVELYLDSKTNSKIEEFSTSNFFGITKKGDKVTYHTPTSPSILPSITNDTIIQICQKILHWEVKREDIYVKDAGKFDEIGATGTAVVVTPVSELVWGDVVFKFNQDVGECTKKLYDMVQDIQYGRMKDQFGWIYKIE